MIELKHIKLKFDRIVLNNVSLSIRKGERLGIIGENGAGKSSLLKVIAMQQVVDSGTVKLDGETLLDPRQKLIPGYDEIQLVGVQWMIEPYLTVAENIAGKMTHLYGKFKQSYLKELLDLTELRKQKNQKANTLSAGEKQRLSIARALACEPDFLLLDEPFVNLDQRSRFKLMENLLSYQEKFGAGMILVSHDGAELMGFVNRIIHLNRGKIRRDCPACEMYYYPQNIDQGLLMGYVNELMIDHTKVVFRPNEYVLSKSGIKAELVSVISSGFYQMNQIRLANNEIVNLVSVSDLPKSFYFNVSKKSC